MQENKEAGKERILFLDSARGLAAISVMIWHFLVMFFARTDESLLQNPLHLFYYGEANVVFFFIHSGFILSYSYFDKFNNISIYFFLRFFLERLFRIIPLFLFILSVSYLAYIIFQHSGNTVLSNHGESIWKGQIDLKDFLLQINLFAQSENLSNKRLIPQDWTLTVELIAGLSIPILLGLLKSKKSILAMVFFILSVKFLNTYIFEFGCGLLLFVFRKEIVRFYKSANRLIKVSALILSLLLYTCFFQFGSLFSEENVAFSYSIDRMIVIAGCLLIFSILLGSSKVQKLLSNRSMVLAGKICYSLYLWHMLWLILFSNDTYQFFNLSLHLSRPVSLFLTWICFFSSTFILSYASYEFIEVPFNKLGKRVAKTFSNKSKPLNFSALKSIE